MLVLLTCLGCSGARYGPQPRDRWLFSNVQGWFIFSTWTGVTAKRTVYDWDNQPVDVTVLEEVRGSAEYESAKPPAPTIARETPTLWLADARQRLLTTDVLPPEMNVRIDGFIRPQHLSGNLKNARTGFYDIARGQPLPPGERPPDLFTVRMIKARRIVEILPDGKEREVWKTDVPFRGL